MLYVIVQEEVDKILKTEQVIEVLQHFNLEKSYNANKEFYNLDDKYYLYPEALIRKIVEERISILENKYDNYWLIVHSEFIFSVLRLMKRNKLIKNITLIEVDKNNCINIGEVDKYGHLDYWPRAFDAWQDILGDLI